MVQLVRCTRPGSLENGGSDYFYLSDSYFWELVSTLAFVCPQHFTEQVHLQRHQHTQTPVTAPRFGGTLIGICSFPCFPAMLQEYPAQAGKIQVLREHFSSPALNIWKPQWTDGQILAKRQCWYLPSIIHDSHLVRSIGRVFVWSKGTLLVLLAGRPIILVFDVE